MPSATSVRSEAQIFYDLVQLCASPGYVHVIAYLCFRDSVIIYDKELTGDDVSKMRSFDRLIRTEIATLIGCMCKSKIDWYLPTSDNMQVLIKKTEALLQEMHDRLNLDAYGQMGEKLIAEGVDPTSSGPSLREAIFYAAESAYVFQYRDMAAERYADDADWLSTNKGYRPNDGALICKAISEIQNDSLSRRMNEMRAEPPDTWTFLPAFRLNIGTIADATGLDETTVRIFLNSFSFPQNFRNNTFNTIDDFNATNATPILRDDEDHYILFQYYSLVEATYETPFYWFANDEAYFPFAAKNRGIFTERFLINRLQSIFKHDCIFNNVDVYRGKRLLGEIDCLLLFGEYAIIFQAKSQKLTIPSRKGNIKQIEEDFKKAVQSAYDQAARCEAAIGDNNVKFISRDRGEIDVTNIEYVYPICVLAEHYPALAMQSRAFLRYKTNTRLAPPLVCDLFLIDVATEMLPSPLRFISYVTMRAQFGEKILVTNELATFGYFLRQNLWIKDDIDMILLDDSVASDLDVAMAVRREGLPGDPTPEGILTKLRNTALGRLVAAIEHDPNELCVSLGLRLLEMGEESVKKISKLIDRIAHDCHKTGKDHDLSIPFEEKKAGLTIHCNNRPFKDAQERLRAHMIRRKYAQRAERWYGILLDPKTGEPRFGAQLKSLHVFDYALEEITSDTQVMTRLEDAAETIGRKRKVGRNDSCPCGSGRKYKKCCLRKLS